MKKYLVVLTFIGSAPQFETNVQVTGILAYDQDHALGKAERILREKHNLSYELFTLEGRSIIEADKLRFV